MSALPAHPETPSMLRVVPAMPVADDGSEGQPPRRVKNTIRCGNDLCKLPLCEITTDRAYTPLHARPTIRAVNGVAQITLTCPGCQTVRVVTHR